MAVKEWFRKLQPVQLYLILFFTSAFFIVEIVASYITHSLTLLLNAYHMLCNIIALIGWIASIKYRKKDLVSLTHENSRNAVPCTKEETESLTQRNLKKESQSERRMKNTFGWARIDVLTMLVCCVFLTSLCFSLLVEALQTLIHIDHLDEMHHPLPVMSIGASGLLLNAFCYITIGGYTFNQGIFLYITKSGEIILKRSIGRKPIEVGKENISVRLNSLRLPQSQGLFGMCRDVLGCVFVIIASLIVYLTESSFAKFVDPIFAIVSAISLLLFSLPYMKESGLILLQTIPNHINIDSLKKEILETFPGIVNVHDLHVWQLTEQKVISTVHIIFLDPKVYGNIIESLKIFFKEMGITQVTIQPEFYKMKSEIQKNDCLIQCRGENCRQSQCCLKEFNHSETIFEDSVNSEQTKPLQPEKSSQLDKSENSVTEKSDCDDKNLNNITQTEESNKQMCHVTIEFCEKEVSFVDTK